MKKTAALFLLFTFFNARSQPSLSDTLTKKRITLPNGWSLTPVGKSLPLGDLPLNITVSPSKQYIAVSNSGQSGHSLQLIGVKNETVLDSINIHKTWLGLKFSADSRYLYASGGNDNCILKYTIVNNKLFLADSIKLGVPWLDDASTQFYMRVNLLRKISIFITGLLFFFTLGAALFMIRKKKNKHAGWILFGGFMIEIIFMMTVMLPWHRYRVAHTPAKISPAGFDIDDSKNLLYVVTKENNSLYIVDLSTKKIVWQYSLGGEGYTSLLSGNKKELYISCWGCGKILVFDTRGKKITAQIPVGNHPNDICLTKNDRYLFVANANDNSVSVIDLEKKAVVETLDAALYPGAPQGSTTNALALSEDDHTLYAGNADNNCLAVFDVSKPGNSKSNGFIPAGWYPTAVKVIGKKIFVANGKGFSSFANPLGPNPMQRPGQIVLKTGAVPGVTAVQYIAGLFKGTLSIFNQPGEKELALYSRLVYENTPYTKIKETQPEGEPGNPVPGNAGSRSPIKYVFYIIKENRTYDQVLGDMREGNGDSELVLFGKRVTPNQHALAGQFVLLDNFYCDAEVSADGHNWSLGAYATDYLEKTWPTSYGGRGGNYEGEGRRAIANNKNGFIWNYCKGAGISYRSYGEFVTRYSPNISILKNHYCPYFKGWDVSVRDTSRVSEWKTDFDSLLAAHALPQLNTLYFGNDHTEGLKKGRPTPFAHVADNDLAVGEFIAYLSKSPVWNESVVFIVEDDAQNGPDHVDAHRTTAYIAGGYVKRHFVDHTMYSTSSMLRTIELILGIGPMSQYDAGATPMWRCFSKIADPSPFIALPANIPLDETYTRWDEFSKKSAGFDFSKEDKVPEDRFNEVLWKGIKGIYSIVPSPKRAAFVKACKIKDGREDD